MATKKPDKRDGDVLYPQPNVSKHSHPELYAVLVAAGPYHRAKRLVELASYGLAVRNGQPASAASPPPSAGTSASVAPAPTVETARGGAPVRGEETAAPAKAQPSAAHYTIPEDADDLIGAQLDGMLNTEQA